MAGKVARAPLLDEGPGKLMPCTPFPSPPPAQTVEPAHRGAAVGAAPVPGQDEDEAQAALGGIRQQLVKRFQSHIVVHAWAGEGGQSCGAIDICWAASASSWSGAFRATSLYTPGLGWGGGRVVRAGLARCGAAGRSRQQMRSCGPSLAQNGCGSKSAPADVLLHLSARPHAIPARLPSLICRGSSGSTPVANTRRTEMLRAAALSSREVAGFLPSTCTEGAAFNWDVTATLNVACMLSPGGPVYAG